MSHPGQGQGQGQEQGQGQGHQGQNPAFPLGMYPGLPTQTSNASSLYMSSSTPHVMNNNTVYSSHPSIPQYSSVSSTPTSSLTPNVIATSTLGPVLLSSPATVPHPATFPSASTLPPLPVTLSNTPPGTAPRKQLAAAAAAGAAAGSSNASATTAGKSGRPKGPYKKAGATGKRGGGIGGRGGRGGRGGGRGGHASGGGRDGDDYMDEDAKGSKDSDDDNDEDPEVSIEEQFILRLPEGPMCDRFREKVIAREIDESVILRFKDPRRGTFTFDGQQLPTKLVDLPTIIEAQKTLNGKQMYKIADISQMLIVDPNLEDMIKSETPSNLTVAFAQTGSSASLPPLKQSEYVWPDGLTNPLKNVRKRRFRKRISKVAVEGVENEIERLLQEDAEAEEVIYEIREQVDGMDRYDSEDGATPAPDESGRQRAGQSDMDMDDQEMMDMDEEEEEEDDDLDLLAEDLERQIDAGESEEEDEGTSQLGQTPQQQQKQRQPSGDRQGLGLFGETSKAAGGTGTGAAASAAATSAGQPKTSSDKGKEPRRGEDEDEDEDEEDEEDDEEEEDDDDDDDDSGSEDDDDDEEEDDREKLLKDEIKDLNIKVKESDDKVQSAPNDLLKRRFGTMLENLRKELELKMMQLEEVKASKSKKSK